MTKKMPTFLDLEKTKIDDGNAKDEKTTLKIASNSSQQNIENSNYPNTEKNRNIQKIVVLILTVLTLLIFGIWGVFDLRNKTTDDKNDNVSSTDSLQTEKSQDSINIKDTFVDSINKKEAKNNIIASEALLLGTKTFGSHYIEPYGRIEISKTGSNIQITGLQSSGDNYCKMKGYISIVDDRNFLFNGEIALRHHTTDYDPNTGTFQPVTEEKVLTGEYKFRRIGSRKYWRLKQPETPTGYFEYSYHYIDVFMY